MQEKPITFDAKTVQAILDGHKTQTRRVVKPQPIQGGSLFAAPQGWAHLDANGDVIGHASCPYGRPGDLLWVREPYTWGHAPNDDPGQGVVHYGPDEVRYHPDLPRERRTWCRIWHKRPAVTLPRWASRVTLEIVDVRVERVQSISQNGVLATKLFFVESFAIKWDEQYKRQGHGWDTNPWVWVIGFRRVEQTDAGQRPKKEGTP